MTLTLEQALARLEASAEPETFFQTSFVLLKILQNVVSSPEDEKYRRIRCASKLLSQNGAEEVLRTVGFHEEGDFLVCPFGDDSLKQLVNAIRFIVGYRRRHNELSAWEIPTGCLTFNERVGKGKFGEVYRGSWDSEPVAIKTLRPKCEDYAVEQFKKEANIMRLCKHTNILLLRAVCLFVEPSYLVLDLMKCCYLDLLREGSLGPRDILNHITQVAAGVEYLHHLDIIHCDIAARNILYVLVDFHGILKLSDFGMARFDQSPECNAALHPGVFPTRWTAPEVFTKGTLSKYSDLWSFGITFYEFATAGGVPYAQFTNKETKQKVLEGYRLEQPADCPDKFYEIMMQCWNAKPDTRPSITHISQSLLLFKAERADILRSSITLSQISIESTDSGSSVMQDLVSGQMSSFDGNDDSRRDSSVGTKKSKLKSKRLPLPGVKVILRVKSKQKSSDIVAMALKKVGKDISPSMFALVEVFDADSSETTGTLRYLSDKEQPLVVKRAWTKRGRFFLFNRLGSSHEALLDALNAYLQRSDNAAKMQYKTRGYLIKFDEYVRGTKGHNVSKNWGRYWTLLDGSTMLFYKDEEDEEGEPLFHLSVKGSSVVPASDYTKKKSVLRLTTENADRYLLHASNKDDMYRWVEAIHSVRLEPASVILDKFGSGEVLKSGFLTVTRHMSEPGTLAESLGRNWFVLKDQHLSFFHQGERMVAVDFNSCVSIMVRTPSLEKDYDEKRESTSTLLSFGIEVALARCKFLMKPDTPGEQEEWLAAFEKALTPIGKAGIIELVEPNGVFQEQGIAEGGTSETAVDSYVRLHNAEGFQPLPSVSEEDVLSSGPTSPSDTVELSVNPRPPLPEADSVRRSSSSDSVVVRLQRSLSQRKGGGYVVRGKLLKSYLDESVVYGSDNPPSSSKTHTSSLSSEQPSDTLSSSSEEPSDTLLPSNEKLQQESSLPDIDELPPPPEDLLLPSQVEELPALPDDLPPPPPEFDDFQPPSLPVKSWKESSDFLSGPEAPAVDRETKPGRRRAHTVDSYSGSSVGYHGDSDFVRTEYSQRSVTLSGHPRQGSDEYVSMHNLSNGTGGRGVVVANPNYVAMAPYLSQPIDINGGNYVRMSAVSTASAIPAKKTHLGRQLSDFSHERQDSVDAGTTDVLLYPSHSPVRTPSPTDSPRVSRTSHSSLSSTPGSSAPSTPQPIVIDPYKITKQNLFSSPRRTIADMDKRDGSPQPNSLPQDLPAAAGVGYIRPNTLPRQMPSSPTSRRARIYSHETSVSPEDSVRRELLHSLSSDQFMRSRSDSSVSRASTTSQRSQSSLSGVTKTQPLPAGWKSQSSSNGKVYYYNTTTRERTWNINDVWASVRTTDCTQTSMAPGWEAVMSADGRTYYYHKATRRTTWSIADTWRCR